jgi:RimJ/RimL family protein N-acetyltransferase
VRAQEFTPSKLVIFDIDDTLVHTQTKVHVVKNGQVVNSLNSHEFTHYKLQPGEQFDFENFRNAHDFFHKSKPIIPMLNQLKQDIATGNKVVMVTARADFDDRELFLDTFRKYGVDMGKVHVYRAGNMTGKMQTEEKKKIIIRELLNKGRYTKAIMYDDAEPNLQSFVELKAEYPKTKFYAWHVSLEGEASEYQRTNETSIAEAKEQFNHELAQKGFHFEQEINGVMYKVTNVKGGSDNIKIHALDAKGKVIGNASFWRHQYQDGLESLTTIVEPAWHGKGIATNMYAVMRMLGVNIHPATMQTDDGKKMWDKWRKQGDAKYIKSMNAKMTENFADGKNPQDKGDSKRHGVPTKASVSTLRKVAKQGGRKGQLAHWMANMKAGKKK